MSIATKYPTIWALLKGTDFHRVALEAEKKTRSQLNIMFKENTAEFVHLLNLLSEAIVPEWANINGTELEANLAQIVADLGEEKTRRAFRDKLIVQNANALQDTCYEIAVTAKACAFLDKHSVDLEMPIQDEKKNSDVYGTYSGNPVRIEVTVQHEPRPVSVDLEFVEIVQTANVTLGFRIEMKSPLTSNEDAVRMKGIVEELCRKHAKSGGANLQVQDITFKWIDPIYRLVTGTLPIESVMFYSEEDGEEALKLRDIIHGATVSVVTPPYIREDSPNPPGVVDIMDLPEFQRQQPISKKFRDRIDRKLRQCESGLINIVAFGNPDSMYDSEVKNALRGAPFIVVTPEIDTNGHRHGGQAKVERAAKAPFKPAAALSKEDQENFINAFKVLSAVWHIRIGHSPKNEIFINPNANVPLPKDLETKLLQALPNEK